MAIHAEELRRYLAETTGRPISLRMNNNTHSLINARRDGAGPGIRVSLHRMFLQADEKVLKALARFVVSPTPEVRRTVREFINLNHEQIAVAPAPAPRRSATGSSRGRVYNLRHRANDLNHQFFNDGLRYRIIWGRNSRGARRRQRHVTLGTWNDRQGLIRIHPMLDHPNVPTYFLEYIIYHEMVHIVVPAEIGPSGRRHVHTPAFYKLERRYPHYHFAIAWEKKWLPSLIREWGGGAPLPARANDFFPTSA